MSTKDAYGVVGSIAEQAISLIRTVNSYVGENEMVKIFCNALDESLKLGVKQGLT